MPEHRRGKNTQCVITDAGLAAFGVFFMQSPSFLAHQRDMQRRKGENNASSLFEVKDIPSDAQIRNLLDPLDAGRLEAVFWGVYAQLDARAYLAAYQGVGDTRLISLDGTQDFSSQRVHCHDCRVTVRDGEKHYVHQVLLAVLCAADQPHVVCLEPEFTAPQDGHEKQDCEQQAIERWVERNARRFGPWSVTVLADDLHCHQPTCELLPKHELHFILTCKPESRSTLYEEVRLLEEVEGAISTKTVRRWNGRHHERWVYRWAEQVPLRKGPNAARVNWCALRVIREDTRQGIVPQRLGRGSWPERDNCRGGCQGRSQPLEGGERGHQCGQESRLQS